MRWMLISLLTASAGLVVAQGCDDTDGDADADADVDGDGDGDGDGDAASDADCERPSISTDNLGEECGGDAGVECMEGQLCAHMTPSVPDPTEVCLISCSDDCDCPAGLACLFRETMPGSPVPHCGVPQ